MLTKTFIAAVLIAASLSAPTFAAGFPEKDITFLIPFKAGGGFDATSRIIIKTMKKYLPNDVNVIPRNVPGAGGKKAYSILYKAKADGYTIASINYPGAAVYGIVGENVSFNFDELTWIGRMNKDPYILGVRSDSKLHSLDDMKNSKNNLSMLVTGAGSTAHVISTIAAEVVGIDAKRLTGYTSSKAYLLGLLRGDGDMAFAVTGTYRKFIESGDIRPIVTFASSSEFDGLPTIGELGYPELTDLGVQRLIAAPPGLPADVRQILSNAVSKALADPEVIAWSKKTKRGLHPLNATETEEEVKAGVDFFKKYTDIIANKK